MKNKNQIQNVKGGNMTKELSLFFIAVVAALLIGGIVTYGLFTRTVTVEVPGKEVKVPVETIVEKNVTVIKEVPVDVTKYRDTAIQTVSDKLKNNDGYLTCGTTSYGRSDIKISRVYDDFTYQNIDPDYNKYAVTFKARYAFDDGSRNSNVCYDVRTYKVTFENNEKPIVALQ